MAAEVIEVKDHDAQLLLGQHDFTYTKQPHDNLTPGLCVCRTPTDPTIWGLKAPVSRFAAASGMTCVQCGGSNLLQTGTCFTCNDCGGTGGCG